MEWLSIDAAIVKCDYFEEGAAGPIHRCGTYPAAMPLGYRLNGNEVLARPTRRTDNNFVNVRRQFVLGYRGPANSRRARERALFRSEIRAPIEASVCLGDLAEIRALHLGDRNLSTTKKLNADEHNK